jgi:hypothetical protein
MERIICGKLAARAMSDVLPDRLPRMMLADVPQRRLMRWSARYTTATMLSVKVASTTRDLDGLVWLVAQIGWERYIQETGAGAHVFSYGGGIWYPSDTPDCA